jgi:hypothetical protein
MENSAGVPKTEKSSLLKKLYYPDRYKMKDYLIKYRFV